MRIISESRIDGDFNGFDSEKIFKLQNGQSWQQSVYTYSYKYSFSPKAIIFEENGTYFIEVLDMKVQVRRLQ